MVLYLVLCDLLTSKIFLHAQIKNSHSNYVTIDKEVFLILTTITMKIWKELKCFKLEAFSGRKKIR